MCINSKTLILSILVISVVNLSHADDMITLQHATVLGSSESTIVSGVTTAKLDGTKPYAFDIDNDGNTEYLFMEGARIYIKDPDQSSALEIDEGWSGPNYKEATPLIFFIAPGKAIVAHYGKQNINSPYGIDCIKIRSLFDGNLVQAGPSYTKGELIAIIPINAAFGPSPIKGDTFIPPGSSGLIWFTDNTNIRTGVIEIAINNNGAIDAQLLFQHNRSGHFGNGLTETKLCNQSICKRVLIGTDIIDIHTGEVLASWSDLSADPVLNGVNIGYTTSNHMDSNVVAPVKNQNLETEYLLAGEFENGRIFFAKIIFNPQTNNQITLEALAADLSDPNCGSTQSPGAEALSFHAAINGFPPDPIGYIVNGCNIYALSKVWHESHQSYNTASSIIPPLTNQFYFDRVHLSVPNSLMNGDILCSRYYCFGGVSLNGLAQDLEQIIPEIVPTTLNIHHGVGARLYSYQQPGGSSGQFAAYLTANGAMPRNIGGGFYFVDNPADNSTTLHFSISVINAPNSSNTWNFDTSTGYKLPLDLKFEASLVALAHIQQNKGFRTHSSYELHNKLRNLQLGQNRRANLIGLPYSCNSSNSAPQIEGPSTIQAGKAVTIKVSNLDPYTPLYLGVSAYSLAPGIAISNFIGYPYMGINDSWMDNRSADANGEAFFTYVPAYVIPGMKFFVQAIAYCPDYLTFQSTAGLYSTAE